MKLGSVFDSLGGLPFDAKLDHAVRPGVQGARVNTGGWSTAPQFDRATLQAEAGKRRAFQIAFADRGLDVVALNGNGNPLHPTDPKQGQCLRDTIRTAGEMGIKKVCTMSGLPEGRSGGLMPNWGGCHAGPPEPKPSCAISGKTGRSPLGPRSWHWPRRPAWARSRWNCMAIRSSEMCHRF